MPGEAAPARPVYQGSGGRAVRAVGELEPGMLDLWWLYPPGWSERAIHHLTVQRHPVLPLLYVLMISTVDDGTVRRAHYQVRANAGPDYDSAAIPDELVAAVNAATTFHVHALFPAPDDAAARELARRMVEVAARDGEPALVPTTEDDRHGWTMAAKVAGLKWCVESVDQRVVGAVVRDGG